MKTRILWLEDIEGERALAFVERQNRLTLEKFDGAGFARDRDLLAAIYDRPDNIPYVTRRGGRLYNLWKDAKQPARRLAADHPRGVFASQVRNGKSSSIWTGWPPTKNKDWLLAGT